MPPVGATKSNYKCSWLRLAVHLRMQIPMRSNFACSKTSEHHSRNSTLLVGSMLALVLAAGYTWNTAKSWRFLFRRAARVLGLSIYHSCFAFFWARVDMDDTLLAKSFLVLMWLVSWSTIHPWITLGGCLFKIRNLVDPIGFLFASRHPKNLFSTELGMMTLSVHTSVLFGTTRWR